MYEKRDSSQRIADVVHRNTGMDTDTFLHPERMPYLAGLHEAAACFLAHRDEPVTVVGDYDVDGICATAILVLGLRKLGIRAAYRLPRRFSEGYGLSEAIIDEIQTGVVVTVDNGIAALEAVRKAKEKGLTVIVTDHHQAVRDREGRCVLPEADALVDPNAEDTSAYRGYCGAGIAYRFVQELTGGAEDPDLKILASLATVADVMPLTGANRLLVQEGLQELNSGGGVPGLRAILTAMGLTEHLTEEDYGFKLGPVCNASGRLYDDGAERVLQVLLSDGEDPNLPERAETLIQANQNRKQTLSEAMPVARRLVKGTPVVIYHPGFGEGIIGLIAGNLQEEYHCPAVVFTKCGDGSLKGSARSIPGVDLKEALDRIRDTMAGYGGHAGAAGIRVEAGKLDAFRNAFQAEIGEDTRETPDRKYDLDLTRKNLLSVQEELKLFAPFGEGNPKPLLRMPFHVSAGSYRRIGDGSHLLFKGRTCSVLGFSLAQRYEEAGCPADLWCIGHLQEDWYQGECRMRFELVDFEAREAKA